jgi:hypothetical protein
VSLNIFPRGKQAPKAFDTDVRALESSKYFQAKLEKKFFIVYVRCFFSFSLSFVVRNEGNQSLDAKEEGGENS